MLSFETLCKAARITGVAVMIVCLGGALGFGQGKGGSGGGGGQGRPPSESTMNLSYPASFFGTSLQTGVIGTYTFGATTTGMSYGCLIPETIGTTTYPNTSCVTATATSFTADSYEACLAKCTALGNTLVEPIFWQKNSSNKWQGGYASQSAALPVEFVDWGDNLEGKTWPAQTLRVETNTFSTLPATTRFDMWHVFGQGTNELWGAHATYPDPLDPAAKPLPYVYSAWPYAVNVTASARLNIAKLVPLTPTGACPATATGTSQSTFTESNMDWQGSSWYYLDRGTEAVKVAYQKDMLYGAELNIKGSYVYGYNWNVRNEQLADKSGWWRLTFYTPDNSVDFSVWKTPAEALVNTLAPPTSTLLPAPISTSAITPSEGESGLLLYVPIIDKTHNLTYLDICIKSGNAGGGGGSR